MWKMPDLVREELMAVGSAYKRVKPINPHTNHWQVGVPHLSKRMLDDEVGMFTIL